MWHEDGTRFATWSWSSKDLRTAVELRPGRLGGVVPQRRGERRAEIVQELANHLPMVDRDPRGPRGLSAVLVAATVERTVDAGGKLEDGFWQAATEHGCSFERARTLYYEGRDMVAQEGLPEALTRAEVFAELDILRQNRRPTSLPLNPYAVPLEDLVAAARIVEQRRGVFFRDAAAAVAYFVHLSNVGAILRVAAEDQGEDQR